MKFFFRSCYRPKGTPPPQPEESDANSNTHVSASLTVPSSRRNRQLTGSTGSKSKSASAAKHWRPELSMISEDNVAHQVFDKNRARVSEKKSSGGKPRSSANSRSIADIDQYDSYRYVLGSHSCLFQWVFNFFITEVISLLICFCFVSRNKPAPVIFPAFSATPYMF